jgi:hypothetical protein
MVTSSVGNRASFGLKTLIEYYPQLKAILEKCMVWMGFPSDSSYGDLKSRQP